jgi:F420H(2)-dependent quinone reductase
VLSTESLKTWLVKHVVSPIDRVSFRLTGGRLRLTVGRPVLLPWAVGRRTGKVRPTPVFYLRDGQELGVCNVRPPGERTTPGRTTLTTNPMSRSPSRGASGR